MQPFLGQQHLGGVRRVLQDVVVTVAFAAFDLRDLFADGDHRVDETVQFGHAFGFGRLDHQRAGHRKAHRGRMEAVIHQALGDVFGADAAGFLERAHVQDALVRHAAVAARVQDRVVVTQAGGNVVGVQDGDFGGAAQAVRAHQRDVHERDRQDAGRAERSGRDRADLGVAGQLALFVHDARQIGRQVRAHRHGAHAGAAAAVRDAEGLVQVQVGHVRAELAGLGHADHCVHVGAVQVNLAAGLMHQIADFGHGFFEHAVRGRVRDHQRGQLVADLRDLGAQVREVHVAIGVRGHHHHIHAGQLRRGGVGAVRRRRDQADVALVLAVGLVVTANGEQARVFALRARVGLQADVVVAGDFA